MSTNEGYSFTARYISTWEQVTVEFGPDRLVVTGITHHTGKLGQSSSLGLRYDQIDQLIIDLLTAKRMHDAVIPDPDISRSPDSPRG